MNVYGTSAEETVRTRRFLKEWAEEGFLTPAQFEQMEREAASEVRTTSGFLALALFFFTLVIVAAAVGLFFAVFLQRPSEQTASFFLMVFAAACYGAAELAVSRARLYRFGIVEALVLCSIAFLCGGIAMAITGPMSDLRREAAIGTVGSVFSLWMWRRFGISFLFVVAMGLVLLLPSYWTSSPSIQHVIVALSYLAGLAGVAALRAPHRFNYLNDGYSFAEGFLWLGVYLALNLQLSSLELLGKWTVDAASSTQFPRPFYWTTWVLVWLLPPIVLARGIHRKDRLVMGVGGVTALLTMVTNKPYLGWPRHTWDPMILGVVLTAVALGLRRWLAQGPDGIRHGFTAERLSARHKQWMSVGATAFSLLAPQPIEPATPAGSGEVRFGGGDSGGGGASSDF
jgi:hypothetical protein